MLTEPISSSYRTHYQITFPRLLFNEMVSLHLWNVSRSDVYPLQAETVKNGCASSIFFPLPVGRM